MSDGNDTAFPTTGAAVTAGITKRDLFAAMAMQGLCARSEGCGNPREVAEGALRYADALLSELEK
jgi:hypothetical protein